MLFWGLGIWHSFLSHETTDTSVIIKYTIKNKGIAVRCNIRPIINLGFIKIETTFG
jgi:hypothetical protein